MTAVIGDQIKRNIIGITVELVDAANFLTVRLLELSKTMIVDKKGILL